MTERKAEPVRAHEPSSDIESGRPLDDVEPFDADLRRLHVTVSRRLRARLEAARAGPSHVVPGASAERVLEAALDLLLERQARRRGIASVRDRGADRAGADPPAPPACPRTPRAIPAAVRREVWLRDGGRCQPPRDTGSVCGSTLRLELDHVVPWPPGGASTAGNLRLACATRSRSAARATLGEGRAAERGGRSRS